ncbi:MAG: IS21 family transposase [Spirochaetes bacterium]|nr:IS21 family transposase [Spirochaetota bacterium]
MARKRIGMKKIREVIRLRSTTEMSNRQIARALNISRPIVMKYWQGFKKSGLSYEKIKEMADSELLRIIEKPSIGKSRKYQELMEYFPYYVIELKRTGVTLYLLWEEYRKKHPQGYQYSQFCYHFQIWRKSTEVRMHIKHKAGDKTFVDYAGDRLSYFDRDKGKQIAVETFVAVLGASGLTYVECSKSQEKEEWILSNENAIHYFGGSTSAYVPDNLRSGVKKADRYEPEINPEYAEFADYYGTVIIPARVREARDKALVENAVRIVYQRIYAPLRNRTFYSLKELNEAVWELLEEHNNKDFQRLKISRRELFNRIEKSTLKKLPKERFPMKTSKWVTVQFNYHVELRDDRHYYSVPYYLYQKEPKTKVKIVYDKRIVAIYYDNIRIAQHARDYSSNGYTTNPDHMPENHRAYSGWSSERFLKWAKAIGEDTCKIIDKVLTSRKHPEQAYRVCLGILNLARKYGNEKLNKACKDANYYGTHSYKRIKGILKMSMEKEKQHELDYGNIPDHENIRGSQYYN